MRHIEHVFFDYLSMLSPYMTLIYRTQESRPEPAILVEAPARSRTEYSSILHTPHDTSHMGEDERVAVPLLLTPGMCG